MPGEPGRDPTVAERPAAFFEAVRRAAGYELQRRLLAPGLTGTQSKLPSEVRGEIGGWVKRLRPGKSVLMGEGE